MAQRKTVSRSKGSSSRKKTRRGSDEASERYEKAVESFERAVKALHKGDFEKARSQFESVLATFSEETELADRALCYMRICDRKSQAPARQNPTGDSEGTVAFGVFLHNQGDYRRAVTTLEKAVEMDPKNDHAQYCLAASYARAGDSRNSIRLLKRAIGADPYNRIRALSDGDFDSLRNDATLVQLLAGEVTETTL